MPCFKLGIRFNRPDIVKRFLQSGRAGFYLAVLVEGEVTAGDSKNCSPETRTASPWRMLLVCTEQKPQTKSFCVALPKSPRFQKLGKTTFVSACGIQMIEPNAVPNSLADF
jgi:MOSC domain-containing protein YiiM